MCVRLVGIYIYIYYIIGSTTKGKRDNTNFENHFLCVQNNLFIILRSSE